MAKYDKVAGGTYGIYKKRESNAGTWIGAAVLLFIIIAALA